MDMVGLIAKRRDNQTHTRAELDFIARAAARSTVPDYQLSAWLMAAYLNPLSIQETADLTLAMAESGDRIDLTGLPKPWVDKHSTGGVGDKTTIVLLPLLAACGLTMVKMSGRGLGITGGTVDKLESIPGFRTDLTPDEMKAQAKQIGLALTGQTPTLAPADKTLYALRDVTATVPSLPLIVSSILSKKIAGGAETVILDVKCGRGAFMPNLPEAQKLAQALQQVGTQAGLTVRTRISDMDQPLGRTAGNALEIKEAISVLANKEQNRFSELCREFAVTALSAVNHPSPHQTVDDAMTSGSALQKAKDWFAAQGANPSIFENDDWQVAPIVKELTWQGAPGYVERVDALLIGQLVVDLGGGRKTKSDSIDHRVGVETLVQVGGQISPGQPIARIHAAHLDHIDMANSVFARAVSTLPTSVQARPAILL